MQFSTETFRPLLYFLYLITIISEICLMIVIYYKFNHPFTESFDDLATVGVRKSRIFSSLIDETLKNLFDQYIIDIHAVGRHLTLLDKSLSINIDLSKLNYDYDENKIVDNNELLTFENIKKYLILII